jgi:hypothetical protein
VVADLGCLAQDTFYISVSGVNCNGYRVSAQVVTNAGIADQEPNNSIAQAMTISQTSTLNGTLGAQHIGTIQLSDVRDYYRLVMPDHGQLSASVVMSTPSTNSTLLVQLLYSDGVTVHQSDTLWNGSAQIELTCMQPDTLYLKVEQMLIGIECHVYNLFVEMTADPGTSDAEPNNSDQQAVELSSGQSAQGLLGYFRYGTASNDGIDVYRFDAQAGDVALSFNHFEVLQNAWITVSSASQPSMLIVLAEDIPSFGLYLDTLDVMQNEAIYVSIQDADECGAYELQLTQLNYLGIGDRSSENGDLIIYPNPAKAYLGIHIAGNLSDGTITIFDMLGRSKYEGQWGAEKPMEINIEHFESGIYSVVFQNGENQMIGKVVVAN